MEGKGRDRCSDDQKLETVSKETADRFEEMPKKQKMHGFVKFRPSSEESDLKTQIEEAEQFVQTQLRALSDVKEKLHDRKADRDRMRWQLGSYLYTVEYGRDITRKRIQMEYLEQDLDELCSSKKPRPRTFTFLCSPNEKLHEHYRQGHYTQQISLQLSRNRYQSRLGKTRTDIEYLRQTREELDSTNKPNRMTSTSASSPNEPLNDLIRSLQYRIQHGMNGLAKERKLFKEIRQAEAVKEKHNGSSLKPDYWFSNKVSGSKQAIEEQMKVTLKELVSVKKKKMEQSVAVKRFKALLEAAERDIRLLEKEMEQINRKRNDANHFIFHHQKHVQAHP